MALPELNGEQLEVLRRFALMEAKEEEVLRSLSGIFECDLGANPRFARTLFRVPTPGVIITRKHVERALDQQSQALITRNELARWATMLLMNDGFELDPQDEDSIAEWLNEVSFGGPGT
ncbi:MAG: hypothetical protein WBD46_19735 [Acidobacteriaceae bacterium]